MSTSTNGTKKHNPLGLINFSGLQAELLPLGALLCAGFSTLSPTVSAQTSPIESINQLPAVTVQGKADNDGGMLATTTRVGKIQQNPHDVPQAVTTITRSLMEQQQVGSLREALRNVSGISFNAAEGGRSGDNVNLRGFYTFGDLYLDGIRDTAQYNRETFNLEQIDVLRGAGAMLFGRGQAGGVINQVTKVPHWNEQYKLSGSVGSHGFQEATADLNKPISDGTALRVNLMKRDEGSWRSNPATGTQPEIHREGMAMSLGLNLRTDNQFWINHSELRTNDNPDYGVSFDPTTRAPSKVLPASYFWGTDRNFDKSSTSITSIVNALRVSPGSELRTQVRIADYDRSYWAKTPSLTTPPDALGGSGGNQTRTSNYKTVTVQSDYFTKFSAFGMDHQLLSGIEYLNEDSSRKSLQNLGTILAPDFRPFEAALSGNPAKFTSDSYAIYAQDTVEFVSRWKATLGIRRDQMDATYNSVTSPRLTYAENSFRAAISFHPIDDTHFYLAWSDSFSPTADLYQLTVTPLPPERSNVTELGGKWLLLDGDLALRVAIYQASKAWERNADLEATAAILTKKRRTNGFELEAAGRITEHWEVFAGAALMNARIIEVARNINPNTGLLTEANPEFAGKRARNTPPYTMNIWTSYQLSGNWKIGGGVEAKGDRQAVNPSSSGPTPTLNGIYQPNTAPAFTRWDAMLAYEQNNWTIRLNVKNLLDKVYYDAVYDNGGFTVPGTRRSSTVTATYKF
jgi:catecholate siderophore receptor